MPMSPDDVNMSPKPQPIGDPPPETGVDSPPLPPDGGIIDTPPGGPEPETNI